MSEDEQGGLLGDAPTIAERLALAHRAGGVLGSLLTAVVAFFVGGLVVLASGANPLSTYRAIFDGSGLNWLFPWVTGLDRSFAAANLQQTLLLTTSLLLCGLAVAFAFRSGIFNLGGLGQSLVAGTGRGGLPRARVPRRLRASAEPDDARLRGTRRRLQPGGGALCRHRGRAHVRDHDGDRGDVRRSRGCRGRARLAVPARRERRPELADRLHRDRCGRARPQPSARRARLGPALRGAPDRDLDPQPRPGGLPARSRGQPDPDHPGVRRPLRRCRRAR